MIHKGVHIAQHLSMMLKIVHGSSFEKGNTPYYAVWTPYRVHMRPSTFLYNHDFSRLIKYKRKDPLFIAVCKGLLQNKVFHDL